jgi:acyl transferase domain-containing protein/thioesterase domain-containing protein/acyl carrier protein
MVFMFPGGGAQYVNMGRDLYESEPLFREHVDRGLALLQPKVDFDVHRLLFPSEDQVAAVSVELQRPSVQLAPIFILEYAMAQLWISWGVQPDALIGHSLGENTAACVAGVMSFPDALGLVTLRGQLFERVPAGGMLSVPMRPDQLKPLLGDELDLAVVNGPEFCVASGRADALDALQTTLSGQGVDAKRIPISIAAHSRLLAPILEDFGAYLRSIPLLPPRIPFLSNRTGTWITTEQATSPDYWVQHLRHTVMFGDGVGTLLQTPGRVFLEVGPGKTLGSLAKQHPAMKPGQSVIASMRHPEERVSDAAYFLAALGQVWATGYPVELARLWTGETRRRVPLPTYAFQRQRFWIEPGKAGAQARDEVTAVARLENLDDWFHRPVWRPAPVGAGEVSNDGTFLLFMDEAGLGRRLERRLRQRGLEVVTVCESDAYLQASPTEYFLSPESGREGYDQLIRDLVASGKIPGRVIHLWLVTADESFRPGSSFFHRNQERGFYSLFFLAQAMADEGLRGPRHFCVVANGMQQTADEGLAYPEKATVLGPCRVIPRELPEHTCVHIDLTLPNGARRKWGSKKSDGPSLDESAELLEADVLAKPRNGTVAYRAGVRWEQHVERCRPAPPSNPPSETLREKGVYLITGGLGGLGLTLAEHLAAKAKARIVLVGRSSLPPHAEWDQWEKRNGSSGGVAEKVRRIRAMEAQGAEVFTVAADVTDVEQMRAVVRAARERFGAIHGVFHAAGALHDDLIQVKTQSEVEEVFAPKVQGTLVLDSLFEDGELDCLVLFSSTSSVLAPPGQIDYVAANAFLNAFARSRSPRRKTRTVAVNWGVWNEVGMAAEAAARMSRGGGARSMTEEPVKHPMFSTRLTDGRGLNELHASYRATAHWFLDEHRTLTGHALVPGTGFIEMARAALRECGESGDFEINDLFFFRPLTVGDDETKEVRVRIRRIEAGYTFDVQSKCTTEGHRVGWETHAQARLLLHALSPAETLPVEAVEARCSLRRTPEDPHGIRSKQEDFLRFGPRWRVLRRAAYGKDEAVARVEIPARFEGDLKDFALHPALLDFATGFAIELIHGYEGGQALWVPVSYQSIRVRGPLPARLVSWVRNQGENRADKEFAAFDVVLAEPGGRVVVEVEGFSMKRIGRETDFALARKPSAAELEWETAAGAGDDRQLSPAERAFRHNLRHGIKPAEGLAALDRILTQERMPEVIVTSLELEGLFRQVEASGGRRENTSAQFDRPTLDSEFVEPRDDVEKTLVGFWQELLGVKSVGVRDSFFDLGGHSLIAVRLFARIKKAFQVEYPISVLFEAPTIERCAEMIRSVVGADGAHKPEVPESRQRRYKHLVPMHPKEPGSKTPFFLIAGMFGNVLNLRHLAHLIGTDRAFYGVQARGLYGDDLPHETFEEMAADYLAELRAVRPHGPYLLGGFSGGGIAAFEISQQLRADGEEVPLLVLLDTPLPQSPPLSATDKTRIHWQRLKRQGPAYLTQWARNRIAWELKKRHARPEEQNGGRPHTEFRSEAIKDAFYRALPKYQVRHFPGVITLFRPKLDKCFVLSDQRVLNAEREFVYHDNGWGPYADQVDVHEVPGDHDSMVLEPNVRVMAAKLRSCLAAAETTAAPVAVH